MVVVTGKVSSDGRSLVGAGDARAAGPRVMRADDDEGGAATVSTSAQIPFGLETMDLPDTDSGLATLFDEMPEDIDGMARRSEDYELAAQYGDLNGLLAALQSGGEDGTGSVTVMDSISTFEDDSSAQVEASQLDPSTELLWLLGSFVDGGGAGLIHVALWGEPSSSRSSTGSSTSPTSSGGSRTPVSSSGRASCHQPMPATGHP